jgi:hypothetical protein
MLAGTLTLLLPVVSLARDNPDRNLGLAAFLFMAGVQIPAAVWLGDLVARRFDPHAPQPEPGRDLRPTFALAGVVVWVGMCCVMVPARVRFYDEKPYTGEREVMRTLRAIARAQDEFHQDQPDPAHYAGNLTELRVWFVGPPAGIGTYKGYTYRLIRGRRPGHWAAAADPLTPGRWHYVISGGSDARVLRSDTAVPLDPETCALDPNLEPVW